MYFFQKKFDIRELAPVAPEVKRVLIVEPESYLCALYAYHLSTEDYFVKPCSQPEKALGLIENFSPHVLLLSANLGRDIGSTISLLKELRKHNPFLVIITVGSAIKPVEITSLMAVGVNAHVDRQFSKPQDIVAITHSLLINK